MANKTVVLVFGPNLRDQSKGSFHVHAADCKDCGKYGPGKPFGGETDGPIEVKSIKEVVENVYSDQINEGEAPYNTWKGYVGDFHFAPCLKGKVA